MNNENIQLYGGLSCDFEIKSISLPRDYSIEQLEKVVGYMDFNLSGRLKTETIHNILDLIFKTETKIKNYKEKE